MLESACSGNHCQEIYGYLEVCPNRRCETQCLGTLLTKWKKCLRPFSENDFSSLASLAKQQNLPLGQILLHESIILPETLSFILLQQQITSFACQSCKYTYNYHCFSQNQSIQSTPCCVCKKEGSLILNPPFSKQKEYSFVPQEFSSSLSADSPLSSSLKGLYGERYQSLSSSPQSFSPQILGEGGNAYVIASRDIVLERDVALKIPKDPQNQKLLKEAKLIAELEHPNIISLYDMGFSSQTLPSFLVMRKYEGKNLLQMLTGKPIQEKLQRFIQVCEGLSYAHSKKVLHLDMKPENIITGNFGEITIIDWGWSKKLGDFQEVPSLPYLERYKTALDQGVFPEELRSAFQDITQELPETLKIEADRESETRWRVFNPLSIQQEYLCFKEGAYLKFSKLEISIGSPFYMAPEQRMRVESCYQVTTDVYCLGMTLYTLLLEIESKDLPASPEYPLRLRDKKREIPKALEQIVQTATQDESKNRYPSVESFKEDLNHYLNQENGKRFTLPMSTRIGVWIKKSPRLTSIAFMTFLFILIALNALYQEWNLLEKQTASSIQRNDIQEAIKLLKKTKYYSSWFGSTRESLEILVLLESYQKAQNDLEKIRSIYYSKKLVDYLEVMKITENPGISIQTTLEQFENLRKLLEKYKNKSEFTDFYKNIVLNFLELELFKCSTPRFIDAKRFQEFVLKEKPFLSEYLEEDTPLLRLAKTFAFEENSTLFAKIETRLESILEEYPNAFWVHYIRAFFFYSIKRNMDIGEQAFLTCLALNPENVASQVFLAAIKQELGKSKEALSLAYKILESDENSIANHFLLGYIFYEKEILAPLALSFKEKKTTPGTVDDFYYQGFLKLQKGSLAEAYRSLSQAIQLDPTFDKAYHFRGYTQLRQANFKEAVQDLSQAIQLNPQFGETYIHRGSVYLLIFRTEEAEKDFQKGIEIQPDARSFFMLALAYRIQKNNDKAIAILKQGIQVHPQENLLRSAITAVFLSQGKIYFQQNEKKLTQHYLLEFKKYASSKHPQHNKVDEMLLELK
ncbi:MAG: protein kinase [Planctomycetota bacterium]